MVVTSKVRHRTNGYGYRPLNCEDASGRFAIAISKSSMTSECVICGCAWKGTGWSISLVTLGLEVAMVM